MEKYLLLIIITITLLAIACAVLGSYSYFQSKSLYGDVLSHSVLPGIVGAFLLSSSRNPLILFIGAIIAAFLAIRIIEWLKIKTKLSLDALLALVLSVFFSLGLFLLSLLDRFEIENKAGISDFIFGKIAGITSEDFYLIASLSLIVIGVFFLFRKVLLAYSLDETFLKVKGFSIRRIQLLFQVIQVAIIAVGIELIGIVLISAFLIFPIVIAKSVTNHFFKMLIWAMIISVSAIIIALLVVLNDDRLPFGPTIICTLLVIWIAVNSLLKIKSKNG